MNQSPSLDFCRHLFAHGVLTAQRWPPISGVEPTAIEDCLRQADHLARLDAPGTAPELDMAAAQWALCVLAWSTSLLVDRANASTALPPDLAAREPSGQLACHHWSTDLAFRYLSEVLNRAQSAAPEDAFVAELSSVCSRWPLADVGTQNRSHEKRGWQEERGAIVLSDPCLRQILVDRIIQRSDKVLAEEPALKRYIESCHFPSTTF